MNQLAPIDKFRSEVIEIEKLYKSLPQVELKVKHYFSKGVYARELHIPAGVSLIGEIHKYENFNILSKGRMRVSSEHGIREVEAGFAVVSPPGTKRIAYALEDCIWTTVHGTDERDLAIIEKAFIAKNETEYLDFLGGSQLRLELL